jgi:hypothetical protein
VLGRQAGVHSRTWNVTVPVVPAIRIRSGTPLTRRAKGRRRVTDLECACHNEQDQLCHRFGLTAARALPADLGDGGLLSAYWSLVEVRISAVLAPRISPRNSPPLGG